MKKQILTLVASLLIAVSPAIAAESLDSAKAKGYLGEQADGYLGAPQGQVPAEVASLMSSVNAQRKAKYEAIAQKNGTQLSAVEALAGQKAIELTPAGQFIKLPGQGWTKK